MVAVVCKEMDTTWMETRDVNGDEEEDGVSDMKTEVTMIKVMVT